MYNKTIIVMIVLLLFAYGCVTNTSSGEVNEAYNTGSSGLTVKFVANAPPSKVYDDENFQVVLEVSNDGSTDIVNSGTLYLSGFDTNIITGIDSTGHTIHDLEGKDMYRPKGDIDTFSFDAMVRDLESREVDYFDTSILATLCYTYETIAAPTICVDPDPYSLTNEKKVCSAGTVENLQGSQAAPVAVSNVKVEPAPGKSRFEITIKNVGGGTVIKEGAEYLTKCNPYNGDKLDYEDVDYVQLTEVKIGDSIITDSCKPLDENMIRLTSGSGTVWCELDDIRGSAYKTPMKIKLRYNYRNTEQKQVRIVQTP